MPATLKGISSMATRQVLAELASAWQQGTGIAVDIESVGGVDAAKRVQAGEAFDLVFLASDAMARLDAAGKLVPSTTVPLVRSGVAVAVREGTQVPDLSSESSLKQAVLAASTVGYSTGPSGTALLQLFERWGIAARLRDRLVQATPGVPVASLVADGKVALGFQQLSELIHVKGIAIAPMPAEVQVTTIFAGAVCATASQPVAARELLDYMASPQAAEAKRRQGMDPA